jgi:hypothetical protein
LDEGRGAREAAIELRHAKSKSNRRGECRGGLHFRCGGGIGIRSETEF